MPDVREVAEIRAWEAVPRAPRVVAGLAEHRGRIVTMLEIDEDAEPAVPGETAAVALLLAEPLGHLGLLVRGRPSDIGSGWLADAEGGPVAGSEAGPDAGSSDAGLPFVRTVPLADGGEALLIKAEELAAYGTRRVRATFRVAGPR